MKAIESLPEGYTEICSVDIKNDKKSFTAVNLLSVAITVIMTVSAHFIVPVTSLFSTANGLKPLLLRVAVLLILSALFLVYQAFAEIGVMKLCGIKKINTEFIGANLLFRSDMYYDRSAHFFINLVPPVLSGIVFAVVCFFVPQNWFWVVYGALIVNISSIAGNFYFSFKFSHLPKDILIRDSGAITTVYSKE